MKAIRDLYGVRGAAPCSLSIGSRAIPTDHVDAGMGLQPVTQGRSFAIGQQFDGTPVPFVVGTAACAIAGFVLIVLTEPKRMFAPMQADPEEQEAARESTAIPEDLG